MIGEEDDRQVGKVMLSVVDGGKFKAEMAELGAAGGAALGRLGADAEGASKGVGL